MIQYKVENLEVGLQSTLLEDVDLICEIEKQNGNLEFITPYSKERHLQVIESKDEEHLTVWHKETNKLIGFIILAGLQNQNLSLEFRRIVIQPKGKGFGRQCLQLIKTYCFDTLKFHRLWLDVFEDNSKAISLYQSEGFLKEGVLRDIIKQKGNYRTLLILSMLEDEYFRLSIRYKIR